MEKKSISDRPLYRFMSVFGDLILLSFLWLLFSVPVVTIGASSTALLHVTGKMAAKSDYRLWHDFFAAFRQNWKQATLFWLPALVFGLLVLWDIHYGTNTQGAFGGIVTAVAAVLGLLLIAGATWGFALLARFHYVRVKDIAADALRLSAANLPASFIMIVLVLWVPALAIAYPEMLSFLLPLVVLLGPGGGAWVASIAVRPAFIRIEKQNGDYVPPQTEPEDEPEDDREDDSPTE